MQKRIRELVGFLIASRVPNLIIIGYVQFGTAYFLMNQPLDQILTLPFALLILSTNMVGSAGYIINDYFDQKIDMINRPEKVVIGNQLKRRLALAIHFLLSAGAIAIGLWVNPFVALIHFFSTLMLLLYSSSIKRVLLIDTCIISLLTSLTLFLVLIFYGEIDKLVIAYALFGGIAIFIRESIKDIISTKGDRIFGLKSISSTWGMRRAKRIIYLACVIGIVLLSYYLYRVPHWHIRYFFLGLFVFIGWFIFRLSRADRMKDFQELKFYMDLIVIAGLISIAFS